MGCFDDHARGRSRTGMTTCAAAGRRRTRIHAAPTSARPNVQDRPPFCATSGPRQVDDDHVDARAAELVMRVAALIPTPSAQLCADETSWSGFAALLTAASDLLADTFGTDGIAPLRTLTDSRYADHPVGRLLIAQVLDRLSADGGE